MFSSFSGLLRRRQRQTKPHRNVEYLQSSAERDSFDIYASAALPVFVHELSCPSVVRCISDDSPASRTQHIQISTALTLQCTSICDAASPGGRVGELMRLEI